MAPIQEGKCRRQARSGGRPLKVFAPSDKMSGRVPTIYSEAEAMRRIPKKSMRRFFPGRDAAFLLLGLLVIIPVTGCTASPGKASQHMNRGRLLLNAGQEEAARAEFEKAMSADPDNVMAYRNLGILYFRRGNYLKALEVYRALVRRKPTLALGHFYVATTLYQIGAVEEALAEYERTILLAPTYVESYYYVARILSQKGENRRAAGVLERALRLESENPLLNLELARAYEKSGHRGACAQWGRFLEVVRGRKGFAAEIREAKKHLESYRLKLRIEAKRYLMKTAFLMLSPGERRETRAEKTALPEELRLPRPSDVFISLHERGYPVLRGAGSGKGLMKAVRAAVQDVRAKPEFAVRYAGGIGRARVKIDIRSGEFQSLTLGPATQYWVKGPVAVGVKSEEPFEVGIHGVLLRIGEANHYVLPSDPITEGLGSLKAMLEWGCREAGLKPGAWKKKGVTFRRFETEAFLSASEGAPGAEVVALYRGIPRDTRPITAERLRGTCRLAGYWLVQAQLEDGRFRYAYDAVKDRYEGKPYSMARHAGALLALLNLYRETGERDFLKAAELGVRYMKGSVVRREKSAFITRGGKVKLGAQALGLLALLELAAAKKAWNDKPLVQALARQILAHQRSDGSFIDVFDLEQKKPPEKKPPSRFFPGEAILALTAYHRASRETAYREAAECGARHLMGYRRWAMRGGTPPLDAWLARALTELYRITKGKEYREFAFLIGRSILHHQKRAGVAEYPDYVGGFAVKGAPMGASTAALNEGLVAVWALKRELGLDCSAEREAALDAARFQLRHQYRKETAYWPRNLRRTLGGFRGTLFDNELRIDHIQHNVCSLLAAAKLLAAERSQ
jgi:tetratricopeptide (TPR) repeat protein